MTGTPTTVTADATYTLRGTDEYGRTTDDTFTLEITAVAAAPTLDTVTFTDNNDGTPAELAITYTGDVTGYRVYMATGDSTFDSDVPTDSELYNETGAVSGVLEYANFAVGSNIDITGLTSTSNSATRIAVRLIKSADGSGTSNAVVETVSGLDFTSPSFSSAEVGTIDADTLEITATETLFGTVDYTDFTLTGNTITAASLSGGKIRLTLGTTATSGDDYTGDLSYDGTGSALVDGDGNALTTFSSQDVTNNVSAGGGVTTFQGYSSGETTFTSTHTYNSGNTPGLDATLSGDYIVAVYDRANKVISAVTIGGAAATSRQSANDGGNTFALYDGTAGGSNNNIVVTTGGSGNARIIVWKTTGTYQGGNSATDTSSPISMNLNTNTSSGQTAVAAWGQATGTTATATYTGLTEVVNEHTFQTRQIGAGNTLSAVAGGSPETFTIASSLSHNACAVLGVYS
jgi:hypothetical protein